VYSKLKQYPLVHCNAHSHSSWVRERGFCFDFYGSQGRSECSGGQQVPYRWTRMRRGALEGLRDNDR